MTREVRKVPAGWVHPSDGFYPNGQVCYDPLFDGATFAAKAAAWDKCAAEWARGEFPGYATEESKLKPYEDWDGPRPVPEHYMPLWTEEERTHYVLYETTTEGTPLSPVFATEEDLACWAAEHCAAAYYPNRRLTYEDWLRLIKGVDVDQTLPEPTGGKHE